MAPASPNPPSKGHNCNVYSTASLTTSISQSRSSKTETLSRLSIDPGNKAGVKSFSNSDIPPNQLQGVVVESLKTPVHSKSGFPSEGGTNTNGAMYSFGGGIMFEPEHSKSSDSGVDGGVAWLLYRQRSRSAGAISFTTNSNELAGVSDLRHTGAPSGQSDVRSSASRHSALFNKLAALIKGSSAHSSTAGLDKSENHSSAYKKRFSFGNNNPNSILAVSTSSLASAASSTREMDGVQSMHFFNLQHHTVMSAGSPASTVSNSSHLPPLSTTATNVSTYSAESHSSTCTTCSYASTASDSTAYTTTSSAASTLCHHHHTSSQRKERSRRIGMRKFFRWTRNLRGETCTATGVGTSSRSKTDMLSTTTSSSTGPRGANSAFFQPREGPSLKELSGRQTRYYDKRGMQVPSTGGAPSGRDRRGAKRVDAKALFSNERTFMHWIKFGLLLGTMALNLTSFGHSVGLKVGLFLVVVAMATLVYSTTIFHVRHAWMAKMRQDVLFYDRIGPSVLFAALFFAYATNVALTMRKMFGDFTEDSGETYFNMDKGPLDICPWSGCHRSTKSADYIHSNTTALCAGGVTGKKEEAMGVAFFCSFLVHLVFLTAKFPSQLPRSSRGMLQDTFFVVVHGHARYKLVETTPNTSRQRTPMVCRFRG